MISSLSEAIHYLPSQEQNAVLEAFDFAKEAHGDQKRYSGEAYITHPLAATLYLTQMRVDSPTLIACLLHDVPEDTRVTLDDVEAKFGQDVRFLVEGITKISKVHYRNDMEDRQVDSLKKLFLHCARDPRTILIKLADRLHNMRTLDAIPEEKQKRIAKESLEIYIPIANLMGLWQIKDEMEDLCFKILNPKEYAIIDTMIHDNFFEKEYLIQRSIIRLNSILQESGLTNCLVHGRKKTHFRIFQKMKKKQRAFHQIYDIIGLRILAEDTASCYQVLGIIHSHFTQKFGRFKDYIGHPKNNGYQSIHTTVFGVDGALTEIQIRTKDMHLECEYGIAAHYFYKREEQNPVKKKIQEKYAWIQKVLEVQRHAHDQKDFMKKLKLDFFEDRIFIFTPKGDVVDLPLGSSVIDFAYALNENLAKHTESALVNHEKVKLSHILKNGDQVQLHIQAELKAPTLEWLFHAKTSYAMQNIKVDLNERPEQESMDEALELIDAQLKLFGHPGLLGISDEERLNLVHHYNLANWEEMLLHIGRGILDIHEWIGLCFTQEELMGEVQSPVHPEALSKGDYEEMDRIYAVPLVLYFNNEIGGLNKITLCIAQAGINIIEIHSLPRVRPEESIVEIVVEISASSTLNRLVNQLKSLNHVTKIQINKGFNSRI